MSAFFNWMSSNLSRLEGNWSDLLLKENRLPKYADAHGDVVPLPDAPVVMEEDIRLILDTQTRKDFRFSLENLHKSGKPNELDFAAEVFDIRFRCNLFHYMGGNLALVMRKLNSQIPAFDALGLPTDVILPMFARSSGILLFSGATGSGKSTSQASGLTAQMDRPIHIVTAEDPVEYLLPTDRTAEVTQREIGVDSENFATALRAALREKPNVIMVGELRDAETIETAAVAANSGHLVLGTTHASTASESIRRLLESSPEASRPALQNMLADAIVGVVSQKLLRRADGKGKCLAYEIMTASDSVRANIRTGHYDQLPSTIRQGKSDQMMLMEEHLKELIRKEVITKETAMAAAPSPARLLEMLEY